MSSFASHIIAGQERGILSRLLQNEASALLEGEGDELGPYTLIQKLGEGGFGMVWRAQQNQPVQREVALKVLKRGMDTAQVLARFELEQQTLAAMQHPAIASLLDAGETEDCRPFFVMELVHGSSITEFCKSRSLPWQERVSLFLEVCRGVQHAHQAGIIHRDLKPSNILVSELDGKPAPKIIDFGIAKAVQTSHAQDTLITQPGHVLGTPQYMSPEQLRGGHPLDIRSDVYSLGVLLYEMLTGELPYQEASADRQASPLEMLDLLSHNRPRRPSTRITRHRDFFPQLRLSPGDRELPADLDWIILKCLEQEKERRYDSVSALVSDLEFFRQNKPVQARPPSFSYLAGRWVRRNRLTSAAVVVSLSAIFSGAAMAFWQAHLAIQAKQLAELESNRARSTAGFLTSLLDRVAKGITMGRNPEALKLALDDSPRLIAELSNDPTLQADLYQRVGKLYADMGERKLAMPLYEAHAQTQTKTYGFMSEQAIRADLTLAAITTDHGDRRKATPLLNSILERLEKIGLKRGLLWFETRRLKVRVLEKLNAYHQARDEAISALEDLSETPNLEPSMIFTLKMNCCQAFEVSKDFPKAEQMISEVESLMPRLNHAPGYNYRRIWQDRRLNLWKYQGKHHLIIEDLKRRITESKPEEYQARHAALLKLSEVETSVRRHPDAIAHAQEAYELAASHAPDAETPKDLQLNLQRRDMVESMHTLALAYSTAQKHPEAVIAAKRGVEISLAQGNGNTISKIMQTLADVLIRSGDLEAAYECHAERAKRINTHLASYNRWYEDLKAMASLRLRQQRHAEALELAKEYWQKVNAIPQAQDDAEHLGDTAAFALRCHEAAKKSHPQSQVSDDMLQTWRDQVSRAKQGQR
jgi:serine/threonine protein kinase